MLTVSTFWGANIRESLVCHKYILVIFPSSHVLCLAASFPPNGVNLKEVAGVYSCQHQTYSHFYIKLWRIEEVSDEVRNWLNIVQRCYFQASTWRSRVVKQGGQHQICNVGIGLLLLILLQVLMHQGKRLLYLMAAPAVNVRWSLSSKLFFGLFASRTSLPF